MANKIPLTFTCAGGTYIRVRDSTGRWSNRWVARGGPMVGVSEFIHRKGWWRYEGCGPLVRSWPCRVWRATPLEAWQGFLAHQKELLWDQYAHDVATLDEAERRAVDVG